MKTNSITNFLLVLFVALLLGGCKKDIFEPTNEDFKVKTFISNIKSYNVNSEYDENIMPVDTTSTDKPYVSVQSWVIKGKDILMSITVPDDAVELYFGAINPQAEYMGLNFEGQAQNQATGYYRLKLSSISNPDTAANGLRNYQVVLSSNENIQIDKFDLLVSCKTTKGISNQASLPVNVASIAPYQKNLKVGFRPLTGYTYTIKVSTPSGAQITYSYNKNTGTETFNNSQVPNTSLSYDSGLDFKWIDFSDPEFGGYSMTATIQIDLTSGSQYIYLYLAIITEGIIDQVSLDADIQQTGQYTAVGTANLGFSYFDELEYKINIETIWSDQFPNVFANYLLGGAGTEGNSKNIITMGASSDLKAHIKAGLSNLPDNKVVLVNLIDIDNNSSVNCNYTINDNIVSISASLDGYKLNNFRVVVGIDNNNNNILDIEEYHDVSPGKIRVIPQYLYNENILFFNSANYFLPYPIAKAFFSCFLNDNGINMDNVTTNTISIGNIEGDLALSNNIGVIYTNENAGPIKSYTFSSSSSLSNSVLSSTLFNMLIEYTLNQHKTEVQNAFSNGGNNIQSFVWSILPNNPPSFNTGNDDDLLYTFGQSFILKSEINITAQCINNEIKLVSMHVQGSLIDLYDFDYGNKDTFARKALLIQAGYGTLGVGGHVFRVEVQLNAYVNNYVYNFGTCQ